jgi:hypothetical protein
VRPQLLGQTGFEHHSITRVVAVDDDWASMGSAKARAWPVGSIISTSAEIGPLCGTPPTSASV